MVNKVFHIYFKLLIWSFCVLCFPRSINFFRLPKSAFKIITANRLSYNCSFEFQFVLLAFIQGILFWLTDCDRFGGGGGWIFYHSYHTLNPVSGTGFFRIPDLGSWIPNPYFWELIDNFLSKKFYNSLKIGSNFFLQHFKNKIIFNFVNFVAAKKGMTTNVFSPLTFVVVFGSGIRDG